MMTEAEAGAILSRHLDAINSTFGHIYTTTLVLRPRDQSLDAAIVIGNDDLVSTVNRDRFIRKVALDGVTSRHGPENG